MPQDYKTIFTDPEQRVGATYVPDKGVYINLWAPKAKQVAIEWLGQAAMPLERKGDTFSGFFPSITPGQQYWFHLDGEKRIADPASREQPLDTDGPSAVVAEDFLWTDQQWQGVPFDQWVIYELHAGTYSDTHDFAGIIKDLPRLKALGITTIELMPVAQFSGGRNWGYDGVFLHAVQHAYGGPQKLKELVDACHAQGLAIILDVVYNHFGPEGNVLFECGPYTAEAYKLPWGEALNFDGAYSDHVRHYFLQSAWQWLTEYHFDGLRLDAVQMIFDTSPLPFLQELHHLKKAAEKSRNMPLILISETDKNDPKMVMPVEQNGFGMDGHWADDFHHALHVTLTGEKAGYYADYGGLEQLAKIYRRGVAFEGEYSPYRKRRHGNSYETVDKKRLIVASQNHDQTGNRLKGERLISLVGPEKARLAAACVLLSPFTPLLFMGEEWGCAQPFNYFVSHKGEELLKNLQKGRQEEWKDFGWNEEALAPGDIKAFDQSVLDQKNRDTAMVACYQQLIALSKEIRTLDTPEVREETALKHIILDYGSLLVLLCFNDKITAFDPGRNYSKIFSTVTGDAITPFSAQVWRNNEP